MKATGIVRRIDDLGRVVIPKEIRRTMRIREGDPLEIFTDRDGGVIFRKYSPLGELANYAQDCCSALSTVSGFSCAICDTDAVIGFSGKGKKDVIEKSITPEFFSILESRKPYTSTKGNEIKLTNDADAPKIAASHPIISEGDITGAIVFTETSGKNFSETEQKLLTAAAMFLGKQLES